MPAYEYTIHDEAGIARKDVIQAADREEAVTLLEAQGFQVVSLHEYRLGFLQQIIGGMESTDEKALLLFTRQLATMLHAGLPLLRCLLTLSKQTSSHHLRMVLNIVRANVEAGMSPSKAMAEFPGTFNHLYVSMVKVGESGGVLEDTMDRLASFLEKDFALRRKIRQAVTYPCFVLTVAVVVVWALVTFIIPRFIDIFYQSGMDTSQLPLLTRVMLILAAALGRWEVVLCIVATVVAGGWLLRRFYRTERGRLTMDLLKINMPPFANLVRMVALARLCRTFATLVSSGLHILYTLEIVGASSGNAAIEKAINQVRLAVHGGEMLSHHMARIALFPPMVIQMVSVGEATGNLDHMLNKLADFYDTEVDYLLGSITALVEPVMIVGVGGVVLFIVLSVFLPIVALVQFHSL